MGKLVLKIKKFDLNGRIRQSAINHLSRQPRLRLNKQRKKAYEKGKKKAR